MNCPKRTLAIAQQAPLPSSLHSAREPALNTASKTAQFRMPGTMR
jgi:hypothetical protein